jgi:hypothetical protein
MPSYQPHTSNEEQEIYTGKHVELIVAQGASSETAYVISKQEKLPSSTMTFTGDLTAHWRSRNTTRLTSKPTVTAHTNIPPNKQPATHYDLQYI